jgi:hypothetical protein
MKEERENKDFWLELEKYEELGSRDKHFNLL